MTSYSQILWTFEPGLLRLNDTLGVYFLPSRKKISLFSDVFGHINLQGLTQLLLQRKSMNTALMLLRFVFGLSRSSLTM